MTSVNPFGKYSDILTTIIAVILIVAAIAQHMAATVLGQPSAFIDDAAILALGAMFGKVSAANGYAAMAASAHKRLDLIGAPPANDGQPPVDPAAVG